MKRLVFLVVALVAAITAASAMAAPAPKATGDYGYSFAGVQRHLTFNAIPGATNICGTFWNVAGVKSFDFQLDGDTVDHYIHDVSLTQNVQSVTGSGSHGVGYPWANHWNITTGTLVGNKLDLTWVYDTGPEGVPGLTHHMTGTIAANGSISGTWNDLYQGVERKGSFTATGATGTDYCGIGTALYTDENGASYFMSVKSVNISGKDAWYAAQILASSSNLGYENSPTNYLFVHITDNAEPGIGQDVTSGDLMTKTDALAAVVAKSLPSSSAIINLGNIQVR